MKTAEFCSPKHPDKTCDRIADAVLDECLKQDPLSRVAVEVMGGHGKIYLCGEVTTAAALDLPEIVKGIVGEGYEIISNIAKQSPEISRGVDTGGAGDQGIMRGYACRENEEMVPEEYRLARNLCRFIYDKYPNDGKTQITTDDNGTIKAVVASFQKVPSVTLRDLITAWLKDKKTSLEKTGIYTNPAGDWNIGGFDADTGISGRKIIIDNYGPRVPVGGGSFSGKDPTKVDRSGAYMARKMAIDILKETDFDEAFVELAYIIGVAEPIEITCQGKKNKALSEYSPTKQYDLTPKGIIDFLGLRKPQYLETAKWGHFGNNFKWDK